MNKRLKTFLLSLLTPGLGYLQTGNKKLFYTAISFFGIILFVGITGRLFITYTGLRLIIVCLLVVYLLSAIHAVILTGISTRKISKAPVSKTPFRRAALVCSFILLSGVSFANRRAVMGFDIMSMDVPAMQPTIDQNEKFLVNTWAYKSSGPERGDIVIHSFNNQHGLYVNRVIAIENDEISIRNGVVFLNGQKLNESYVLPVNQNRPESREMMTRIIPKGHYFVMGDNRDKSFGDSRFSGTITKSNIIGETTDIISSQDHKRIGRHIK